MNLGASTRRTGPPVRMVLLGLALGALLLGELLSKSGLAAEGGMLEGVVLGAGSPVGHSTVTLWAASSGAPRKLAEARTADDGKFKLSPEALFPRTPASI